jgi:Cys-tRNA(Pro)/Cys-tRNA(Cys) deacylase
LAVVKTNAMRLLDAAGISYTSHTYDASDGSIDGVSVAHKLGEEPERVFKTLVTVGASRNYYVFVLPVENELDLKKAARTVKEKSIEMIPVKDINKVTGYIRGGCSPIGMKKQYPTVVDETAILFDTIIFSGGKIGFQIEMAPDDLFALIGAQACDITVD